MKRSHFLQKALGFGLLSFLSGKKIKNTAEVRSNQLLRQELTDAWLRSEKMTMVNMEQMPAAFFTYKYTEEAMTFTEQWRHCVIYTCGQLANGTGLSNPYKNIKLPYQMPKEEIIEEMKKMYAYVRQSIQELPDLKLLSHCDFAGDSIPVWRLFYALENHIVHHRGQCIVYLRLNGVIPKGYYGW